MSNKRKRYNPESKAKVALAALKNEETMSELAARFRDTPDHDRLLEAHPVGRFARHFRPRTKVQKADRGECGRTLQADRPATGGTRLFVQKAQHVSLKHRKQMVDPNQPELRIANRFRLLNINDPLFNSGPRP